MTREALAKACEDIRLTGDDLIAIAAELRKTCATCLHFRSLYHEKKGECIAAVLRLDVPADGSGFCHRWESQPAGKAQEP